ncbi:hypothetical protein K491DRAFT_215789 [Lophiostoma macrostomum CBS 122681]|uniref:Zn(2)-C6 fungal-type domain-containing protein n=1 Tax=Lophiostoma macrostomum CBS 122681 TaxID=1314788 RepID=A0A6A6TJJ1_9PLEO|nr:hypothetical protein K491DRAFT_215789 [Lophiostoma macrostomum CBS 122681]
MAPPSILLREFNTEGISDLVPGKLAQTYQQLERLALGIGSRSSDQWNVHFHFEDGNCEGKALPYLWDSGAYFDDESCLANGKLRLFAHFETKTGRHVNEASTPKENPQRNDAPRDVPPSAVLNVEAPPNNKRGPILRRGEGGALVNEYGRPVTIKSKPKHNHLSTSSNTRSRVLELSPASESDSDASSETQFVMSPSEGNNGDESEDDTNDRHPLTAATSPTLPQGVTLEQYALDFKVYNSINAPPDDYGHKHNWDTISQGYRDTIAHCRLIRGIYGTPALSPCERCKNMGLQCRVYHPDLKRPSETCGECRLSTASCSFNAWRIKRKTRGNPHQARGRSVRV